MDIMHYGITLTVFCIGCYDLIQDTNDFIDEKAESRLYIGNLDLRITE